MSRSIFFLFLFINVVALGQPLIKSDWKASWIGIEAPSLPNSFFKYRKSFLIDQLPSEVIAHISADSKYWLWINGQLVVFEGQLKRGPTPSDTYFDEVNIKPYLKSGENLICILLWYWGKDGFCHKNSGKAGLLFEAQIGNKLLISDDDWKVSPHLAFQNSYPPYPNYRLPEFNIHYDARVDNDDWLRTEYNDVKWDQAVVLGLGGSGPWNKLWLRPIPLWFDSGLLSYQNAPEIQNGKYTVHLPKNSTVSPYFKINAPAGLLIDIRTDNYMGGSEPNIRTEYITRDGIQEFESPAYFNGHVVIYTFPAGVNVIDLKYRETKFNTQHVGNFTCSDSILNKLWIKSLNTLNVNMRDGIQDPDRERAQWWGDVVIMLEEIFYSCDLDGQKAIKKAISNLVEWQKDDGVLYSPVPAGTWDRELPAQMLASIGKYGIWKYIEHSGDTGMIRYVYPFLKRYISLWSLNSVGLVEHRKGGWDWHDWGNNIDVPLLDNAWYYLALDGLKRMALHLNKTAEADEYSSKMNLIKQNFTKKFWKDNRFVSDDYPHFADDRGNGLAVCAGLVNKEQWNLMKSVMDTIHNAGPYLEKYILESYFIMNEPELGIRRMKRRYAEMINSPITTLWEGWEIGSGTYGGGTYNHGWSGGPLSLMSAYIAGIQPIDLGYEQYQIKPKIGSLKKLSCSLMTVKGSIGVDIEVSNQVSAKLTTIDARGLIAIPHFGKYKKISIGGKNKSRNIVYSHKDQEYFYFVAYKKGIWDITLK